MKRDKLDVALEETKRFVKIARRAQNMSHCPNSIQQGKTCASIKRASLDLSNALADLRKSDYK